MSYMDDKFQWFEVKRQVKKLPAMDKGPALGAWNNLRKTERRVDNIAKIVEDFPVAAPENQPDQPYATEKPMEEYWREEHTSADQRRRDQMDELHRLLYPENYDFSDW